ncbi:Tol-Pal system beta propeller repeat protein TolB [Solemya pervernicosa gill symbiont]|uniref:Tol-Pal system protein TolB n=2 Tax=Gammaproteobacteria incertae sedis TaxID=118884 RepID=A0A1T2L4T7_9GAMM|nr:Tol-Pal system beta propeller repeat protein TolB [Candidatus Reidiella endopervernicosa]OOZ40125.1 Tol-Pal system beta propeller repeat protein TolB [Solemya pervernicosa gill symbiont]QKQ27464.1 Tol-Pal system beta propeller repeat protein TolB [Candidatus Reidiella endopervernicosa]
MNKIFIRGLLALMVWLGSTALQAEGLTIEITKGAEGALPIAVIPFGMQGVNGIDPSQNVGRIVAADLRRSGLFKPLAEKDLLSRPTDGTGVRFADWRLLGADNIVVGRMTPKGGGKFELRFQLFDVTQEKQLAGYSFQVSRTNIRRVAHHISDLIYEKLIGHPGAFSTHIAYISRLGSNEKPTFVLQVADADGFNPQVVLRSSQPLMSPAWSPDATRLAYVTFEKGKASIYMQNIRSGKRDLIASYAGINGAPSFSPDGKRMALTLSKDGNPEIYVVELGSRKLRRLTNHNAIDTEPVWSPDGRMVVFTSDRGGRPQLYKVAARGGKAQRLTFEGKYNARASFSPDGRRLAFVHQVSGDSRFRIAVMEMDSGEIRILTDGSLDESPSIAPNGSMVIYAATERYKAVLSAVSVDGRVQQRLALSEGDVREPAWSPKPMR